jgi:hypothetical protein
MDRAEEFFIDSAKVVNEPVAERELWAIGAGDEPAPFMIAYLHDVRLHRLIGVDLLALFADHDPLRLVEDLGQAV